MMFWVPLCICLTITTNIAESRHNIISQNGWKPLTYEEVFNGILNPKSKSQIYPNIRNGDVIKLVKPHVFTEFAISNDASYPEDSIQTIPPTIGLPDAVNNCGTKDTDNYCINNLKISDIKDSKIKEKEITNEKTYKKLQRMPKILSNDNFKEKIKRTFEKDNSSPDDENFNDNDFKNQELQEGETNLYKVTEEENMNESTETTRGYVYEKPLIKLELNQNNITETFFKILSKYNIKVNDVSENYKISRRPRTEIDKTRQFYYLPIPIAAAADKNRINDLNRLLAVFLSKYGYYLPGYYGPSNKYMNLYGYLATNNIHNNKPFGLYKVFADNDSSHK